MTNVNPKSTLSSTLSPDEIEKLALYYDNTKRHTLSPDEMDELIIISNKVRLYYDNIKKDTLSRDERLEYRKVIRISSYYAGTEEFVDRGIASDREEAKKWIVAGITDWLEAEAILNILNYPDDRDEDFFNKVEAINDELINEARNNKELDGEYVREKKLWEMAEHEEYNRGK